MKCTILNKLNGLYSLGVRKFNTFTKPKNKSM